jgi:hypothetical protein
MTAEKKVDYKGRTQATVNLCIWLGLAVFFGSGLANYSLNPGDPAWVTNQVMGTMLLYLLLMSGVRVARSVFEAYYLKQHGGNPELDLAGAKGGRSHTTNVLCIWLGTLVYVVAVWLRIEASMLMTMLAFLLTISGVRSGRSVIEDKMAVKGA